MISQRFRTPELFDNPGLNIIDAQCLLYLIQLGKNRESSAL
jgi:hypothetical protein